MKKPVDNPYARATAADIQYSNAARPSREYGGGRTGRPQSSETERTLVNDQDDGRSSLFAGARDRASGYTQNEKPRNERYGDGYSGQRDAGRETLFAGARQREDYSKSGALSGGGFSNGYGDQRELTPQEQEEQAVMDAKARISQIKDESVNSTRRALQAGEAAMESSRAIMSRLGVQGERLYNAKANLELAQSHNKVSQDRTRELKTLNRSMFAVHVGNPFNARSRQEQQNADMLDRHRSERDQRDSTHHEAFASGQRADQDLRDLGAYNDADQKSLQRNLVSRSKYQFEADEADDAKEDEIESNVTRLHDVSKLLHRAGQAIGRQLDEHIDLINGLSKKSDVVDDEVRANRENLARIK